MSANIKVAARSESAVSRLLHVVPLLLAVALLGPPTLGVPPLDARFLPLQTGWFWIGAALTLAGLLFTVWARVHLGRNWSGIVTVKERARARLPAARTASFAAPSTRGCCWPSSAGRSAAASGAASSP